MENSRGICIDMSRVGRIAAVWRKITQAGDAVKFGRAAPEGGPRSRRSAAIRMRFEFWVHSRICICKHRGEGERGGGRMCNARRRYIPIASKPRFETLRFNRYLRARTCNHPTYTMCPIHSTRRDECSASVHY